MQSAEKINVQKWLFASRKARVLFFLNGLFFRRDPVFCLISVQPSTRRVKAALLSCCQRRSLPSGLSPALSFSSKFSPLADLGFFSVLKSIHSKLLLAAHKQPWSSCLINAVGRGRREANNVAWVSDGGDLTKKNVRTVKCSPTENLSC